MNWHRGTRGLLLAAGVLAACAVLCGDGPRPRLAEPVLRAEKDGRMVSQYFGDAENVRLLVGLLADEDALVRERATLELGQTHNLTAIPRIRAMLKDVDADVRCAAVAACAEMDPNYTGDMIVEALGAKDRQMVLTALRCVRQARLTGAKDKLRGLLSGADALVLSAALHTMTDLGLYAGPEALDALWGHGSAVVRLRAAENALLGAKGDVPAERWAELAAKDSPAVRAVAIAGIGAFSSPSSPAVGRAGTSPVPMLRRGAVWAYHRGGQRDRIRAFLDDASPMVRLAAIRAAGELKCEDCIGRLSELLLDVRDDMAHFAARASLASIGTDATTDKAAEALTKLAPVIIAQEPTGPKDAEMPRPQDANVPRWVRKLVVRNVRSCAWLLGHFKSPKAYDVQLMLVEKLPVDSQALIDLAGAMAKIGDRRAIAPMLGALKTARKAAPAYLRVLVTGQGSHPPFSEEVTAALIEALSELKASEAVPTILGLVNMQVMGARLKIPAAAAARILPDMVTESNRAGITGAVTAMLRDRAFGRSCLFDATKAAVRLKMNSAVGDLQKVLSERDGRQLIHAAAWAVQELTGTTPDLPEPKRNQGEWIITVKDR
ncbi:MAG TPA: HEAT repeat domain-containing protein [Phycisphaerae bacterium]|nr:HEAT repeat domain-containing protein [Phycisphaerae bacterium]HUT56758.1 HEAT repeat domain-containing protein [Phycisphaerae bacterium]